MTVPTEDAAYPPQLRIRHFGIGCTETMTAGGLQLSYPKGGGYGAELSRT